MIYKIIDQNKCNINYKNLLELVFKNSDYFCCCTYKGVHKKEQEESFFQFFNDIIRHEIDKYEFELPKQHGKGQQFHVFVLNNYTENKILSVGSFDNWHISKYPEDLAFFHNKKIWFRCISHEKEILLDSKNIPQIVMDSLKSFNIELLPLNDLRI